MPLVVDKQTKPVAWIGFVGVAVGSVGPLIARHVFHLSPDIVNSIEDIGNALAVIGGLGVGRRFLTKT